MIRRQGWGLAQGAWCAFPLCALVSLSACTARSAATELYPQLGVHAGRVIRDVDFAGGAPFREDTLQVVVQTRRSRCSLLGLPLCVPFTSIGREVHELSPPTVAQDVNRLMLFYRREGYFGTSVLPSVDELDDGVRVTFTITRADPVYVESLTVSGTEGVLDGDSLARRLPLQPGEIFHLGEFSASADTVVRALQARGHAYAELLRNFTVDTATDRAVIHLEALPRPRVVVDSIILAGAENLGRNVTLRQLAFRQGDMLRVSQLIESQRNLYSLDLVQFAAVSVAPDSLQREPNDSARATVLVRVAEASVNQVDVALGWGNVECFRAETRYQNRSFGGGARRLTLTGSASKLGIGVGLSSVCSAFATDTFANALDYRLAAELSQPGFLSARNNLTLNVFGERQSEPTVFQREAVGGRLGLTRRLSPRTFLTSALDAERGSTVATDDALFCGAFEVCDPVAIERLKQARFRNTIGMSILRERVDRPIDPGRGYIARTGLTWAPSWLLSDVTFVRWTGDLSVYTPVKPRWVLATSLRFGNFFQTALPGRVDDFLPPEDRFFAGGANTVRGFDRNRLGPGVYVTRETARNPETNEILRDTVSGDPIPDLTAARFIPSGGSSLLLANVEVRTPSPFLSHILRLAWFVDAGAVTTRQLWDSTLNDLKLTPGAGIRMETPVGPVRVDLAYNPYGSPVAPVLFANPDTGVLDRVEDAFREEQGGFLRRMRIQVAVGQAF